MMVKGMRLVTLASPRNGSAIHINYANYSGHSAQHGGSHYTETYYMKITPEKLFHILKPHMVRGEGNEPDIDTCTGCQQQTFKDALRVVDWHASPLEILCPTCTEQRKEEN